MSQYYYSSVQNVRRIMKNLPKSTTDEDILYHMNQADSLINAKLSGVLPVPFIQPPPLMEKVSTDLTIFFLMESFYSSDKPNLDEYQEKRYNRAMQWLDEIIAGESDRIGADSGFASTNESDPVFTVELPEPW